MHVFLSWIPMFVSFRSRLKALGLSWFLIRRIFWCNKCFISLNLVLKGFFIFLAWKVKETLGRLQFPLWMAHITYNFSAVMAADLLKIILKFFLIERFDPIDKIWFVLIMCLVIIVSYYHLVSLHENNSDDSLLAVNQWLCKYIYKTSIRRLGPLLLFQATCWHCYHVIMSEHAILELVNSVSYSLEYNKFILGIFTINFTIFIISLLYTQKIILFYWINWTNRTKNKYYDWFQCYSNNWKQFISYGEIKTSSKR